MSQSFLSPSYVKSKMCFPFISFSHCCTCTMSSHLRLPRGSSRVEILFSLSSFQKEILICFPLGSIPIRRTRKEGRKAYVVRLFFSVSFPFTFIHSLPSHCIYFLHHLLFPWCDSTAREIPPSTLPPPFNHCQVRVAEIEEREGRSETNIILTWMVRVSSFFLVSHFNPVYCKFRTRLSDGTRKSRAWRDRLQGIREKREGWRFLDSFGRQK